MDIERILERMLCLFGYHKWYESIAYPGEATCLKCGKKRKKPK